MVTLLVFPLVKVQLMENESVVELMVPVRVLALDARALGSFPGRTL